MTQEKDAAWEQRLSRNLRLATFWGGLLTIGVLCLLDLLFIWYTGFEPWVEVAKQHYLATIGLAGIMLSSFSIVVFLRNAEGPIEFEMWGLKFKGGAGQVILWVVCVIALSLCAKLLW